MRKEEIFLDSKDGLTKLHGFVWVPEGDVKAVLQLVHGMAEYIDRYDGFATFLAENGIAVIGHDHLGHGLSLSEDKKLGYFADKNGYEILNSDIHRWTVEAKKRFPGVPNFLLGHSMGSFLVRRYVTMFSHEIEGLVIMGTGYIPAGLANFGAGVAKLLSKVQGPYTRSKLLTGLALGSNNKPFVPNRTPVDWLSRETGNVDKYVADPLCGFMFTNSAFVDFFTFIGKVGAKENFANIRRDLPVFIVSGTLDPVGGAAACPKVLADLQAEGLQDVTMKLYEDDRHEILNEVDKDVVYRDIENWILGHIEG